MAYPYDDNVLAQLRAGIGRVESGGNYEALGPEITRKRGVDRAYGKYQVMGANIPSWTELALGQRMTPLEFLHNPHAQELVFEHQMRRNLEKYGTPENAASVWFSGRPLEQASREGARDVNMPVQQYVAKALGGPITEKGVQVAGGDEDFFRGLQERKSKVFEAPMPQAAPVDFFEGLQKRPVQHMDAQPYAPTIPMQKPQPPVPMPAVGVTPPPKPQDVWGGGMEYLNALSAGAVRPVYSALSGYSPEQINVARQTYEQEYPARSLGAEVAGGVTQGALLGLAAPYAAAAAAGSRALTAVPRVASALKTLATYRPGYAGPFPSGGYLAQPGVAGTALRVGGAAAGGAAQAGLNVKVHPEIPAAEQIATGAGLGAVVTPAARMLFGTKSPALAPQMEEPIRDIGKMARAKYGISLQPWQLSNMPKEQALSTRLLTPEKAVEQAKEFGKAWGKTFSHSGDFTPANVAKSIGDIGDKMDTLAGSTRIDMSSGGLGRQFQRDLTDVVNEIESDVADRGDKIKLLRTIQMLDNKMMERPLKGEIIQSLTQKDGMIDRNISPETNSLYQYYNGRIKSLVYDTFHRADPSTATAWDKTKQEYKAALIAYKGATDAGILDPTVVAEQAEKVRAGGDMSELAQIGRQMFSVSPKGAPNIPAPVALRGIAAHPFIGTALGATIPSALSLIPEFGPAMLSATGFSPLAASVGAAALTGAGYGAKHAYAFGKEKVLSSPVVQDLILRGKGAEIQNVLTGPTLRGGVEAGVETHRARRRK